MLIFSLTFHATIPTFHFAKATFHSRSSVACSIATTPTVAPHKIPLHYILLRCLGVLNPTCHVPSLQKKVQQIQSAFLTSVVHSSLHSRMSLPQFSALSFFSFFVLENLCHMCVINQTLLLNFVVINQTHLSQEKRSSRFC